MATPARRLAPDHAPPERAEVLRLVRPIRSSGLPAYQKRTCVHCGEHSWFQLEDPAGWYTCSICGRYA